MSMHQQQIPGQLHVEWCQTCIINCSNSSFVFVFLKKPTTHQCSHLRCSTNTETSFAIKKTFSNISFETLEHHFYNDIVETIWNDRHILFQLRHRRCCNRVRRLTDLFYFILKTFFFSYRKIDLSSSQEPAKQAAGTKQKAER